jgi:hypothetical protein
MVDPTGWVFHGSSVYSPSFLLTIVSRFAARALHSQLRLNEFCSVAMLAEVVF